PHQLRVSLLRADGGKVGVGFDAARILVAALDRPGQVLQSVGRVAGSGRRLLPRERARRLAGRDAGRAEGVAAGDVGEVGGVGRAQLAEVLGGGGGVGGGGPGGGGGGARRPGAGLVGGGGRPGGGVVV